MRNNTKKKKDILANYIRVNKKEYISLIIIFLIGLIIGVICVNNAKETQKISIIDYINNFINEIKENSNIDRLSLIKSSIQKNILTALLLWFIGLAVISIPLVYFIIAFRGMCIGYTITSIVATIGIGKGTIFVICGILLQNVILIPCMLALGVSGIRLYKCIKRKNGNIKSEIFRHSLFSLFILVLIIIACIIESYISSTLLVQYIKYL